MKLKLLRNYIPELSSVLSGRKKPLAVSVNITSACNQHCLYCEIGRNIASEKATNPNFEELKMLIDEMSGIGIKRLAINGGEPFLYPKILDLIEYAGSKNVRCNITSNGMNIHQLSESEIRVLKKNECEINISVDSMREEIHNYTRGHKNALENAKKSAALLIKNGIVPIFLSALSKYNYNDLLFSLKEIGKLGVKTVLYQPIIYYSNYPDRPALDNKAALNVSRDEIPLLMAELRKVLSYEFGHGVKTNVYRLLPWIESYLDFVNGSDLKYFWQKKVPVFKCRDIYAIVDIAYDGEIQPCALCTSGVYLNELHKRSLTELWLEAGKNLRAVNETGNFPLFCNACCNHFSRNMLYSVFRYPISNHKMFFKVMCLSVRRLFSTLIKQIHRK